MSSPRRRRRSRATRGRRTTSARSAASRSSTGSRRSTWPVARARWGASLGVLEPLLLRGRAVAEGVAALAGAGLVGGLTRRAAEATGGGAGAGLVVDALVEVARLARPGAEVP